MKFYAGLFLLFSLALFSFAQSAEIYSGWDVQQATRQITVMTQNVRHQIQLTLVNLGDQAASSFHLALTPESASHLAFVAAVKDGKELAVLPTKGDRTDVAYYSVEFNSTVYPKQQATVEVLYVFTHAQQPYPTHINNQNDNQLVIYTDNHYFFSPYNVATQKTMVKLPSARIENFSQEKPTSHQGDKITYGPYENIKAFQQSPLRLHFENNSPFLTITKLEREIEVSHWGNVAVTEQIQMQHDGAKLLGSFSRFDYQRLSRSPPTAIRSVGNLLPLHTSDIYYRDEIGNISTSDISVMNEKLLVDLTPRFPLFGGWKTLFTFGYNLPLANYVFSDASDSSRLVLNITFGKEVALDSVIDDLTIRVILPEGSKNAHFELPFAVDKEETALHFTYLDTAGRPVVVLHKKNVVPEHNRYFQVVYNFSKVSMFIEPFLLVITYFVLFLAAMVYVRFELSIAKEKILDPKEAKQAKIQDLVYKFKDLHEQRGDIQKEAAKKAFSGKTQLAIQERKKAETTFNATRKEVEKIEAELDELNQGVALKIKQIERKEREKQTTLDDLVQNEVNNQDRKINSNVYQSKKELLFQAFSKVEDEVEDLIYDLVEDLS